MDVNALAGQIVPYVSAVADRYGPATLTSLESPDVDESVRVGQQLLRALQTTRVPDAGIHQSIIDLSTAAADPGFRAALATRVAAAMRQDGELTLRIAALLSAERASAAVSAASATAERSAAVGRNSGQVSIGDNTTNVQYPVINAPGPRAKVHIGPRRTLLIPFGFIWQTTKSVGSSAPAHPAVAVMTCTAVVVGGVTGAVVLTQPDSKAAVVQTAPQAGPSSVPSGFIGLWQGSVRQPDYGDYSAVVTIDGGALGSVVGKVEWPMMPCTGTFTLRAVTDKQITVSVKVSGSHCIDGTIVLTQDGTMLQYASLMSGGAAAVASLSRFQ